LISIFQYLSIFCALLLIACSTSNEENESVSLDQNLVDSCKQCNASFWATKFTRTHIDRNLILFKFTADALNKRRRKGRMIEFTNYDELYLKGLTIDQPLTSKIVKFDMNEINLLINIDGNLASEGKGATLAGKQIEKQANAEILGNKLTRLLIDDVRINFKPLNPQNQPIVLTANYAKILTDSMTMRFEGHVTLDAKKCKISSEVAVWSNSYNGFFFSESFKYNGKVYKSPAFFQITNTGKCQQLHSVHEVEYVDKLDEVEDKIFQSMPMSTQLLFGLMGAPTNLSGN
jgi:hypothetical protein